MAKGKGLRHRGVSSVVWVLMGLLILGLGGFGITNFGGASGAVATVGDRSVTARDYARALNSQIDALSAQTGQRIPFAQLQAFGFDAQVRGQLISDAALDDEAGRIGISAGDGAVRDQLMQVPAFKGVDGRFDRTLYANALRQVGLGETEFEAKLRDDAARSVLQMAVAGGVAAPAGYAEAIAAWQTERRGFTYAFLTAADLPEPVPAPTEDELKGYYDAHPEAFTTPETRLVSYAWLSPEMLLDEAQPDDATLKAEYDRRIDEFVQPERRLVERLVFGTEEDAAAAKARIDSGSASFADLVKERGLELSDVDLGDVSKADLGGAGDAVFALTEPGVVGPLPSDLGPALFTMNGILNPQETSFEEAKPQLAEDMAIDRARRLVADKRGGIDDLLAGGATVEDLGKEAGMQTGTAEVTASGEGAEGIAAYSAFREAAMAAQEGDFAELHELDDGGLFALELKEIRAPQVQPLDAVRDQAVTLWTRDETARRLLSLAQEIAGAENFDQALGAHLLVATVVPPLTRDGYVDGLPETALPALFKLEEGKATALVTEAGAMVMRLDRIEAAAADDPHLAELRGQIETQARQGIAQDALVEFTQTAADTAGVSLNQAAITAVHAQMQ